MVTIDGLRRPLDERVTLAEPVDGLAAAVLELRLAAAHLDLRTCGPGEHLVELTGHGPSLSVDRARRRVLARQARPWLGTPRPPDVDVTLNESVEWSLDVRAPGTSGWLDLRRLRLGALQVAASGARIHADLPEPRGPVHVRIEGRAVNATLSAPSGTTVRFWTPHGWMVDGQQRPAPVPHARYDVWLDGRSRCRLETGDHAANQRPVLRVV